MIVTNLIAGAALASVLLSNEPVAIVHRFDCVTDGVKTGIVTAVTDARPSGRYAVVEVGEEKPRLCRVRDLTGIPFYELLRVISPATKRRIELWLDDVVREQDALERWKP